MFTHTCEVLTSGCILELSVLEPCGPLGVGGDLPVFPGGVVTVVGVVGVPLPPTDWCKHHWIVSGLFGAHTNI